MNITTKFNINDTVYFIKDNAILKRKINKMEITVTEFYISIDYYLLIEEALTLMDSDNYYCCNQDNCFSSIKELTEFFENKYKK